MPDLNRLTMLGGWFHARCLVGRLARTLTKNVSSQIFQIEYYRIITLGLKFSNSHNSWPSMTYEV
jgi:hypothetical protein